MYVDISLFLGYALILTSIFYFVKERNLAALVLLVAGGLSLYVSATGWYPYLNVWDERLHALVAKNLMQHPLKPTLYNEMVVNMPYDRWDRYHIWLHKQPGFLWQIMVSYWIFGVNEFALRFPSALAFTALATAIARSTILLVNKRAAYYATFCFVTSLYFIELVSGWEQLDHHDVMSITYCGLSIWALIEYLRKPKIFWLLLIGLFAGLAVLNKWLVGLTVFLVWGIYLLQLYHWKLKKYGPLVLSLGVSMAIALPWQILAAAWYPTEYNSSSGYFLAHFLEPLEGQGGPSYYHLALLGKQYGYVLQGLLFFGWYTFYRYTSNKKLWWSFFLSLVFVYGFFALAKTKMPSFTLVISLPVFVALGSAFYFLEQRLRKQLKPAQAAIIMALALVGFTYIRLNYWTISERHPHFTVSGICQERMIHNKALFTSLNLPENAVLFNLKGRHYIEAMFYTPAIAYSFIPSEAQIKEAFTKQKTVFVFRGVGNLPNYILDNEKVKVLEGKPQVCE